MTGKAAVVKSTEHLVAPVMGAAGVREALIPLGLPVKKLDSGRGDEASPGTDSKFTANSLNPYYVTGFADGESCFMISVIKNSNRKNGYRVMVSFQVGLHSKDQALLGLLGGSFGVGGYL
jgi:hypothetical protein